MSKGISDDSADDRAETLIPGRLDVDLIRVGRATDNDIVLDDAMVSRYHAEIRKLADGQWELRDAGSANGIFIDQQRVSSVPVTEAVRVEMGDHLLRITPDGRGAVHVEVIARGRTMQVPKTSVTPPRDDTDGKHVEYGNITARERELLALIAGGATDRQIVERTDADGRVLVTKDRDFRDGHLLAASPQEPVSSSIAGHAA